MENAATPTKSTKTIAVGFAAYDMPPRNGANNSNPRSVATPAVVSPAICSSTDDTLLHLGTRWQHAAEWIDAYVTRWAKCSRAAAVLGDIEHGGTATIGDGVCSVGRAWLAQCAVCHNDVATMRECERIHAEWEPIGVIYPVCLSGVLLLCERSLDAAADKSVETSLDAVDALLARVAGTNSPDDNKLRTGDTLALCGLCARTAALVARGNAGGIYVQSDMLPENELPLCHADPAAACPYVTFASESGGLGGYVLAPPIFPPVAPSPTLCFTLDDDLKARFLVAVPRAAWSLVHPRFGHALDCWLSAEENTVAPAATTVDSATIDGDDSDAIRSVRLSLLAHTGAYLDWWTMGNPRAWLPTCLRIRRLPHDYFDDVSSEAGYYYCLSRNPYCVLVCCDTRSPMWGQLVLVYAEREPTQINWLALDSTVYQLPSYLHVTDSDDV